MSAVHQNGGQDRGHERGHGGAERRPVLLAGGRPELAEAAKGGGDR